MSGITIRKQIRLNFLMTALIFETNNFIVEVPDYPLIDREDGGHIIINPKVKIRDRQALSPELAVELMRLTIVVGEAMTTALTNRGVDIGRINYQDNGNWSVFKDEGPFMHIHIYGRGKDAKIQRYGQSLYFPHKDEDPNFYSGLRPLDAGDVEAIRDEIENLFALPKYSNQSWKPS